MQNKRPKPAPARNRTSKFACLRPSTTTEIKSSEKIYT